jgi:hypothetical protein
MFLPYKQGTVDFVSSVLIHGRSGVVGLVFVNVGDFGSGLLNASHYGSCGSYEGYLLLCVSVDRADVPV